VIVSATNTARDLLFLTEFLHAHNSGVRVAADREHAHLPCAARRAQFSGDLMVDSFPAARLPAGLATGAEDHTSHIFADDVSEGNVFCGHRFV